MKKHVLKPFSRRLLLLSLITAIGIGAHSQKKKPTDDEILEANRAKVGNSKILLLNAYQTPNYIRNYRDKFFRRHSTRHTQSIFLDKSFFTFFDKFFLANPGKYDGIRVFFAAYNQMLEPGKTGQTNKKQLSIIITPTIGEKGRLEDFRNYANGTTYDPKLVKYGQFSPGAYDSTTNDTIPPGNLIMPPAGGDKNPFIFLPAGEATQYIKNYRKRNCVLNKKHTKSIYMELIDFDFLTQFLKSDTKGDYSGIRVFFAGYNKFIDETHNARRKQITLIFTAASNDDTHEPAFGAMGPFLKKFVPTWKALPRKLPKGRETTDEVILDSENHGELCPNKCDGDDHG